MSCEHPFVTCRAGSIYCEDCGLFLPAYPEQMSAECEKIINQSVDKVMNEFGVRMQVASDAFRDLGKSFARYLNAPSFVGRLKQ